jgi:hypothetical protein
VSDSAQRHLNANSFAAYLRTSAPIEHPIPGNPPLALFIDPHHVRVGLRGPARSDEAPAPSGLERLTVQLVHHLGQRMIEVTVTDARLFEDAYPVLCAVADRVQLEGRTMTDALTRTLRQLGHLLEQESGLSRELEIGLLGELSLLIGAIRSEGPAAGLDSWRGWDREEHDFGLSDCDVEMKTTTSERRAHRISSLTQLVPTADRPLWLVSLQVTRAGSGGTSVSQLVGRARDLLSEDSPRARLEDHLRAAGWRDRFEQTAVDLWRLRTRPATFRVAGSFPRLTPQMLDLAGVSMAHIDDVTYRLDLATVPPDGPPTGLAGMITFAEKELS